MSDNSIASLTPKPDRGCSPFSSHPIETVSSVKKLGVLSNKKTCKT